MCSASTRKPASAWCRRSRASTSSRSRSGQSGALQVGERVVVGGAGGRQHSVAARVAARQEFAGYWEYVLDEAIFTAPAHPNWGGTALIGSRGELQGIGSLQLEQPREQGTEHLNMVVPIDLLKPIYEDLLTLGRRNQPPRPWLGLYATEVNDRVVVVGMSSRGPARKADLRTGDVVLAVGGTEVSDLAGLFRRIWAQGDGRRRRAAHRLSRRQDLRAARAVRRPAALPEGAAAALIYHEN